MTVEELQATTEAQLPELAQVWLGPVDAFIGDLLLLAESLEPEQFFQEVGDALDEVPNLYGRLDKEALQSGLEDTQGEAMVIALEETPELAGTDASGI